MGLGRALAARPLSTVTAPQYELALGSESEPAAMTDGLKDWVDSNSPASHSQTLHQPHRPRGPPPLPARGGVSRLAGRAWIRIRVCNGSPRARGVRPEDSRVSGCPDTVRPEGSVSFKPWSLALIPGTSSRFTKSHRKQYKNSNFSLAKEPKPRQTWTGSLEGPERNRTSCCLLIRHWDNTDDSEAGLPSRSSWASICRELDQCSPAGEGEQDPCGDMGREHGAWGRAPSHRRMLRRWQRKAFPLSNAGRVLYAPDTGGQSHTQRGLVWNAMCF